MKYEYDFTNLHLPKLEYKLLRKISKHILPYQANLDNLITIGMVDFCNCKFDEIGNQIPMKKQCTISEKGICYIQYCKNHFVNIRIPIIISLFALAVSIIGFFISA